MTGLLVGGRAAEGGLTWIKGVTGDVLWKSMSWPSSWYYTLCFSGTIIGVYLLYYVLCVKPGHISGLK